MGKHYTGTFLKVIVTAIAAFIINTILYYLIPDVKAGVTFIYPLWAVYAFFLLFSLVILGVLIKISHKNAGQVGYTFLLATGIKMAASYIMARPLLAKTIEHPVEKINFFAVFVLFLAIEAYFTVRLLNNKQ